MGSLNPILNRRANLSPYTKLRIFSTLVRPCLTYACPVWSSTRDSNYQILQGLAEQIPIKKLEGKDADSLIHGKPSKYLFLGYKRHEWHNDIFDEVKEKIKPLKCEPLGGGKISVDPEDMKIYVYGTSAGYGQANHELAAEMIRETYPKHEVSFGEEPPKKEEKWELEDIKI
ncbi:janus/Ocnus family (Ocnus) domain-containing protein [Phthorimaea operculella]|nr:janus/Ocnus family (Ocnus) domain-containing protein [Phthorimaea operculella]